MIRALAADGFDVACMGATTRRTDPGVLDAERATFEQRPGSHRRRRGSTSCTGRSRKRRNSRTPPVHRGLALGFNRTVGFRASTALPFRQFDVAADESLALLEVPLVVEDSALLGPIAVRNGLEHARESVQELVDTTRDVGGALTFLFHPDRLLGAEWLALYEWSLRYLSESGAWLTSLAELDRWWTAARAQAARRLIVVEVVAIEGPLDAERLDWVAELYGAVDPKYLDRGYLDHLLVHGPGGPSLHAFALDDGVPVGHSAVVPTPARRGNAALRAGKLEALVVAESHRGSRGGGVPVVRLVLDSLYALADARGFELLHAFVLPRVGRVIRFERVDDVGSPSLVALLKTSRSGAPAAAERALAAAQHGLRAVAGAGLRMRSAPTVRAVTPEDAAMLATPALRDGTWAVVARGRVGLVCVLAVRTRPRAGRRIACARPAAGLAARAASGRGLGRPFARAQVGHGASRRSRATGSRARRRHPASASPPAPTPACAAPPAPSASSSGAT